MFGVSVKYPISNKTLLPEDVYQSMQTQEVIPPTDSISFAVNISSPKIISRAFFTSAEVTFSVVVHDMKKDGAKTHIVKRKNFVFILFLFKVFYIFSLLVKKVYTKCANQSTCSQRLRRAMLI